MGGSRTTHGGGEKCVQKFSQPELKRPFGRLRRRWESNIELDLVEKGWEDVDWIHLAQDRTQWLDLVTTVINLLVQ
jgi:hypothetical protein